MAIRETLELVDNMSPTLKKIHADMVRAQNDLRKYRKLEMEVVAKELHWARVCNATSKEITLGKKLATMQTRFYSDELKRQIALEKRVNSEVSRGNMLRRGRGSFSGMLNGTITSLNRLAVTLGSIGFLASGFMGSMNTVIEPYSNYISNRTRINLLNDGTQNTDTRYGSLIESANRSRMDADAFISLYNRIGLSGVKTTNDETQRFTELVGKTLAIAGTGAQENRGVMLQLAQGLGSNMLSGDELRTIREQAPVLMAMMSKGLNVSTGELKKMGKEGKLTARTVMDSILKMSEMIDRMAENAPLTIGQVATRIRNSWEQNMKYFGPFYATIRKSLEEFDAYLKTSQGQEMLKNIGYLMYNLGLVARATFKMLIKLISWFSSHLTIVTNVLKVFAGVFFGVFALRGFSAIKLFFKTALPGLARFVTLLKTGKHALLLLRIGLRGLIAQLGPIALGFFLIEAAIWGVVAAMDALRNKKTVEDRQKEMLKTKYGFSEEQAEDTLRKYSPTRASLKVYDDKTQTWYRERQDVPLKRYKNGGALKMDKATAQIYKDLYDVEQTTKQDIKAQKEDPMYDYNKKIEQINKDTAEMDKLLSGLMDPTQNKVPKDVGNVKNVEKVSGDIKLDTESLEMMKNIAERQWTIMNNIEVPQTVNNNITNNNSADWDMNIDALTAGLKIVTGASLGTSF